MTPRRCRGRTATLLTLAALIGVAMARGAHADPLTLTGTVSNAGSSFTIADLQALGSTQVTVGGVQFTGVPLWTFLGGNAAGTTSNVVTTIPPGGNTNNPQLRYGVVATGSDGARSLVSIGEVNTRFGGAPPPFLVAYEANGNPLATPVFVAPQDPTGARSIQDLINLDVFGAPGAPNQPASRSTSFSLSGVGVTPGTFDLAALQALPATIAEDVTFTGGGGSTAPNDYTGVRLWDFLTEAGFSGGVLDGYVIATATDGYREILSLAELDPALNPRAAKYLVAYVDTNGDFPGAGFARLIFPGDNRGGRFLSNLTSLEVVATVSQPATMGLYLAGLIVVAFATRGRYARRPAE